MCLYSHSDAILSLANGVCTPHPATDVESTDPSCFLREESCGTSKLTDQRNRRKPQLYAGLGWISKLEIKVLLLLCRPFIASNVFRNFIISKIAVVHDD